MGSRALIFIFSLAAAHFSAARAMAQVPPFFGGGQAAIFDPEISVVDSGVINDVQAVVSPDRKYVTLNMRSTNTSLLALREFSFQSGGPALGFVGGSAANGAGNATAAQANIAQARGNSNANSNRAAQSSNREASARPTNRRGSNKPRATVVAAPTLLDRPGMTRVDALSSRR